MICLPSNIVGQHTTPQPPPQAGMELFFDLQFGIFPILAIDVNDLCHI